MNLLALDTSTEACSAALLREDGELFAQFDLAPRQHNRLLPQMMDRVLSDAAVAKSDITHCAFANGPGAFTGIRIAAAQAQGIGMALGIPLITVSTLAVMAQDSLARVDANKVLVALDARMGEIYWAVYQRGDNGLAALCGEERLSALDSVSIDDDIDFGAGHGWLDGLRERVEFPVDAELLPSAESLLPLARDAAQSGRMVAADQAGINYLRMQVAVKSAG